MGFMDLSIQFDPKDKDLSAIGVTLQTLKSLGYSTVAINHISHSDDALKSPCLIPIAQIRKLYGSDEFEILTRITVIVDDANINHQIATGSGGSLKLYDIVAVRPTSMAALQFVCGTFDADIISIDLTARLHFHLKYPTINLAISRGMVIEIPYAPAIRDHTERRHLITNSASLLRLIKTNGILLSSSANSAGDIRDPYAVAALTAVYGMSTGVATDSLSVVGRQVLFRARTRRSEKAILEFA